MRVCIPTEGSGGLDDRVGEHFGRVPTYTIVDTETGAVEVLPNESEHMGGTGLPGELLARAGVDALLCAGLGPRAMALLEEHGVRVYIGANGSVRDALGAWKRGELQAATDEDICREHKFGEHHHH
ncbi:MAG: NifB/NifX family molybdenum-iron cluster-binding protein [Candidatus Acetothermia bacterium]|jgi:predicted Fe-Mo cluster-binding NifX family protein|nr:NifB/NifX family molybdenum-iron cluster-binding protein [Candidatus Acetothermia bacterium]MDH7505090.1 NifB/NifX family molybdenum-iron cluster-binding protein [Candidatus Acetothermia bacterium]